MPFLVLLLPATLMLLWAYIANHLRRVAPAGSLRSAFVLAFSGFQVVVILIAEGASIGHNLTVGVVTAAWTLVAILLFRLSRREIRKWRPASIRSTFSSLKLGSDEMLIAGLISVIVAVLIGLGVIFPPSCGDCLSYHLSRVEHWIQNRSVEHFATHFLPEVEHLPLNSFNFTHLHLVSGTDRLDGFIQLLAAVVCMVAASDIARLLGGSRRVEISAALLVATIPSGILESTSAQNNYLTAALAASTILVLLLWWRGGNWFAGWIGLGTTLALAGMSKGTAMPLILPTALTLTAAIAAKTVRSHGLPVAVKRSALGLAAGTAMALLLVGPFAWRNYQIFGSPVGPHSKSLISDRVTARSAAANIVRSVAANFRVGDGKDGLETELSRFVLPKLQKAFDVIGVAPDDQTYAVGNPGDLYPFLPGNYTGFGKNEAIGANPWHVCLIIIALVVLTALVAAGRREIRLPLLIAIACTVGFGLFSSYSVFQLYGVRFGLPLLVLWCPLISLAVCRTPRWISTTVLVLLVVAAMPQLLDSEVRSLVNRTFPFQSHLSRYFPFGHSKADSVHVSEYENLTRLIAQSGCERIAFASPIPLEYALWSGLKDEGWHGQIRYVGVSNQTRVLEVQNFRPCVTLRRVAPEYVSRDDTVNLRWGVISLALDPPNAARTDAEAGAFRSEVEAVRVLPGFGWGLGASDGIPRLERRASLFLFSTRDTRVKLTLGGQVEGLNLTLAPFGDRPAAPQSIAFEAAGRWGLDVPKGISRITLQIGHDVLTQSDPPSRPERVSIVADYPGFGPSLKVP